MREKARKNRKNREILRIRWQLETLGWGEEKSRVADLIRFGSCRGVATGMIWEGFMGWQAIWRDDAKAVTTDVGLAGIENGIRVVWDFRRTA